MNLYKVTLWPYIDPDRKIDPYHIYSTSPQIRNVLADGLEDAIEKTKANYGEGKIVIEDVTLIHSGIEHTIGWPQND